MNNIISFIEPKNNSINNSINTLMLNINRILYFACKYNKLNMVKYLVNEENADVNFEYITPTKKKNETKTT